MSIDERKKKNRLGILEVLHEAILPLHSHQIAATLQSMGLDLSERTVRLYLEDMEVDGLSASQGRRGHQITPAGRDELGGERIMDRIGYMSSHVERMMYLMDFDLATRNGTVVVNLSLIPHDLMCLHLDTMCQVFAKGYAMGTLVGLLREGESLGSVVVPKGHIGLCTVCSITLSGILLKHGVPVRSLFCGLLDVENGKSKRVKELIAYDATSVDPLKLFINSGMTNYLGAIRDGNGRIGIGFREVPSESHSLVESVAHKVRKVGLGAFLEIGMPNTPLLNMPVHEGCCGILVIGGLNPIAVFVESGLRIESNALCGLMEYHKLFPFTELAERLG
jgi:repressor of nif and glnA expression